VQDQNTAIGGTALTAPDSTLACLRQLTANTECADIMNVRIWRESDAVRLGSTAGIRVNCGVSFTSYADGVPSDYGAVEDVTNLGTWKVKAGSVSDSDANAAQQELAALTSTGRCSNGAAPDLELLTIGGGSSPGNPNDLLSSDIFRLPTIQASSDDCLMREIANNQLSDVFLGDNCDVRTGVPVSELCDSQTILIQLRGSPISLVWNESADINSEVAVTRFPLDPAQAGAEFTWKASADFPLLVHDPAKSGKIVSATQLFGNFSFGKRFKDGFAALATLDANLDKEISGAELAEVRLWFDRNRDGVSDEGEVVDCADAGVSALYFTPDRTDEKTGDIIASRGYTLNHEGTTRVGRSIDWYGAPYRVAAVSGKGSSAVRTKAAGKDEVSKVNFSGQWIWSTGSEFDSKAEKGLLTIRDVGKKIAGYSFIETPLRRNSSQLRSMLSVRNIQGEKSVASDGTILLSMQLRGDGRTITSEVTYDSKRDALVGTTLEEAPAELKSSGTKTVRYVWSARRL